MLAPDPSRPLETNNWRFTRKASEGNHVSMSEQRILCTNLLGKAWAELTGKMDFFDLAVKLGSIIEVDEHGYHAEDKIKLQGVDKYSFKDEDAMWGDKPVVDGAAEVPRASKEEARVAQQAAERDARKYEEGVSGVGSEDDGSDGSVYSQGEYNSPKSEEESEEED